MSAAAFEYFATSSIARVRPRMPAPEPPRSSGMHKPVRPASTKRSNRSCGILLGLVDLARAGATRSCASLRTVACSSASSGERSKSIAGAAYRAGLRAPRLREQGGACRARDGNRLTGSLGTASQNGGALRGLPTLAKDATTLPCGEATPHAALLADGQGVLETGLAHGTQQADRPRLVRVLVGDRMEDLRIDTSAPRHLAPPEGCG